MDASNIQARINTLNSYKLFINKAEQDLTLILQSVQWDRSHLETSQLSRCTLNSNHYIPETLLDQHIGKCTILSKGYEKDEQFLPESVCYNPDSTVKLDPELIKQITIDAKLADHAFKSVFHLVVTTYLPQGLQTLKNIPGNIESIPELPLSAHRLQSTYTQDERRAIYDYVVAKTPKVVHEDCNNILGDSSTPSGSKEKSHWEVMAHLRDMKRRRAKYKVATKSKNYSEVLREVIKNQVDLYKEVLEPQNILDPPSRDESVDRQHFKTEQHRGHDSSKGHEDLRRSRDKRENSKHADSIRNRDDRSRGCYDRDEKYKIDSKDKYRERKREKSEERRYAQDGIKRKSSDKRNYDHDWRKRQKSEERSHDRDMRKKQRPEERNYNNDRRKRQRSEERSDGHDRRKVERSEEKKHHSRKEFKKILDDERNPEDKRSQKYYSEYDSHDV